MTLIAAWITDKFRIVASDSFTQHEDTMTNKIVSSDRESKKVFISKYLAVGIWGDFGARIKQFVNQELVQDRIMKENWNVEIFRKKLLEYLNNNNFSTKNEHLISNFLILPTNEPPKVFRVQHNKIQNEFELKEYKLSHQIEELQELFFSEQKIEGKIDYLHQKQLFLHFNNIKDRPSEKLKVGLDTPIKVQMLIRLVLDAMKSNNEHIRRPSISGDKVYYAYSIKGEKWREGHCSNESIGMDPEILDKENMDFMNDLMANI